VYDSDGFLVCTAKTHHAKAIVERMNALLPDAAAIRADEREKCAKEVENRNWPCVGDARRIATAIRDAGRTG